MVADNPYLVLSLDYELFFGRSGSVEKCLFEPSDALLSVANSHAVRLTFFVDAGMIVAMDRLQSSSPRLEKINRQVKRHLETLAAGGCEIQLHVHPHWEDSRWVGEGWDFEGSRYQLNLYSDAEIKGIFASYSSCLERITGSRPGAYRAGGFCLEPFSGISAALVSSGIDIDSSVVPGASLLDREKSFDFRRAPNRDWWFFEDSPGIPAAGGRFLELPVTPVRLPATFYWGRLLDRFAGVQQGHIFGDGFSKNIGKTEIVRRLAGLSRTTEMSMDHAKIRHLSVGSLSRTNGRGLHLMGHPKLLSWQSLERLDEWLQRAGSLQPETVSSLARRIRSGEIVAQP